MNDKAVRSGSLLATPPSTPTQAKSKAILQRLEAHAVIVRTRLRQKISLSSDQENTLFVVRKGVLLGTAQLPGDRNLITNLLFAGDVFMSAAMPPITGAGLTTATEEAELWRIRWSQMKEIFRNDPELETVVCQYLAEQAARVAFHNVVVAGLSGEERVTVLYAELALRLGKTLPAGRVFEMPLSRVDVADYLALNADTVSRIVSRMRSKGLFDDAGRGRIVCRDMDALTQGCPVSSTLTRMIPVEAA